MFNNRHRRSPENYFQEFFRTSRIQEAQDIASENASWDRRSKQTALQWRFHPERPIRLSNANEKNESTVLRVEPYVWSITLTDCDRPCGGGKRTVTVFCHADRYLVDDSFCNLATKPGQNKVEQCNTQPCVGRSV